MSFIHNRLVSIDCEVDSRYYFLIQNIICSSRLNSKNVTNFEYYFLGKKLFIGKQNNMYLLHKFFFTGQTFSNSKIRLDRESCAARACLVMEISTSTFTVSTQTCRLETLYCFANFLINLHNSWYIPTLVYLTYRNHKTYVQ